MLQLQLTLLEQPCCCLPLLAALSVLREWDPGSCQASGPFTLLGGSFLLGNYLRSVLCRTEVGGVTERGLKTSYFVREGRHIRSSGNSTSKGA